MGFKGNIVKAKRTLPTKDSASGVWKLEDVAEANQRGEWPGQVKRDAHAPNTSFLIQAENVDGANNDVRAPGAFINVSNHNAGTGHLDNQGPSGKDTYLFQYSKEYPNQQDQKTSPENPFEKDGYYSYQFYNEYFRSITIPDADWAYTNQDNQATSYWGSAEGSLEVFIKTEPGEAETAVNHIIACGYTSLGYTSDTDQSSWALFDEISNNRRICFSWHRHNATITTPFLTSAIPHRGRGWVHVLVTRDNREGSNSRFRLFVNGMLAATNTIAANQNCWGGYHGDYTMSIGDALGAGGSYYYRGLMSNMRVCKSVPGDYVTSASVVGTHCFDPPFDRLTPNSQGASSCTYLGLGSAQMKNNSSGFTQGFEYKDGERVTASPTHEISNWEPLTGGKGNSWLGTWRYNSKNPVQDHINYGPMVQNISPFHGNNQTFTLQMGSATGVANGEGYCLESQFGSVGSAFVGETITMYEGFKYTFDQQHASNLSNRVAFSITEDGTHGGGVEYTDFVSAEGTPGQSAAFTCITIPSGFTTNIAPTLYYYSHGNSGRGGKIQIGRRYVPKSETHNYGSEHFPYYEEGGAGGRYKFYSGMETGLYQSDRTKAFMFSAREAFCFEGWWKWERGTGVGARNPIGIFGAFNTTNPSSRNLVCRIHDTAGNPNFALIYDGAPTYLFNHEMWRTDQFNAPIDIGQWNHIVVCRGKPLPNQNNANYAIFFNGKNLNYTHSDLYSPANNSWNATYEKHGFAFGSPNNNANPSVPIARNGFFPNSDGNANSNNVKVSNFRYVRGHSVYNVSADSIYLPSSPYTTYQGLNPANAHTQTTADGTSTVVLTFQSQNKNRQRGILDKSPYQRRVRIGANGGNQSLQCGIGRFTPFIKPFGYWSGYFRQNSYLDITKESSSTVFDGTNENDTFTVEAFIMYTAPSISSSGTDDQFNYIFAKGLGSNIGKGLGVTTDGKLRFIYYSDTTAAHVSIESAANAIKFGPWYHVAISNASGSGNLKLFIDGVQVASGTYGATSTQNGSVPRIAMGDYAQRNYQGFTGYISNLRVSNSTRYTEGFNKPEKPFVDDANTTLLCLNNYRWTDSSSNNSTFAFPYGSPQVNPLSPFTPPVDTYDPKVHGASWYMRNNHDANTQFTPNVNKSWYVEHLDTQMEPERANYTLECWLYHEGSNYTSDSVIKGGRPYFYTHGTGGNYITNVTDVPENTVHPFTWNHLVVQKEQHSPATNNNNTSNNGTVARFSMYLNGTRVYESTTWPLRQYNNSDHLTFGKNVDITASRVDIMHMGEAGGGNNRWFWSLDGTSYGGIRGYVMDMRYIKGKNTFPASKATCEVPTKPREVDLNSQFHLGAEGAALPNVKGTSNVQTWGNTQSANNIPARFGNRCMYFVDNGVDHISTPLDINNCMERCSFTIEGFVKFEQIYRLAVGNTGTPDHRAAIVTTGQQNLGIFHIINRGDSFNNTNNGLGLKLNITSSFQLTYNTNGSSISENAAGQPELLAGNTAGHTYNTIQAESDFGPLQDRPGYHRRDYSDTRAPWYHFAVCRDATLSSNNLVLFWNGQKKLFVTDTSNYDITHPYLKIGCHGTLGHTMPGWMDNFRVTKGICRYDVTQDTITVPTEDFPEF